MDRDIDRVLNYLTERLDIAIKHNSGDEQLGYIRAKGMVKDAKEIGFKPDMREKIREYISELDVEIDSCEQEAVNHSASKIDYMRYMVRLETLVQVQSDLRNRLEELV